MRGKIHQAEPLTATTPPPTRAYGFLVGIESTESIEDTHRNIVEALGIRAKGWGTSPLWSVVDVEALGEIETLDDDPDLLTSIVDNRKQP